MSTLMTLLAFLPPFPPHTVPKGMMVRKVDLDGKEGN